MVCSRRVKSCKRRIGPSKLRCQWIRNHQKVTLETAPHACSERELQAHRGTTHWYETADLQKEEPELLPVRDGRYVVHDGVATTTAVTASIPISLALVEAIGGIRQAEKLAARLGVFVLDSRAFLQQFFCLVSSGLGNNSRARRVLEPAENRETSRRRDIDDRARLSGGFLSANGSLKLDHNDRKS